MLAILSLTDEVGVPGPLSDTLLFGVPFIAFVLYVWNTARDEDVANADREGLLPLADLRNWLRRVLKIRVR